MFAVLIDLFLFIYLGRSIFDLFNFVVSAVVCHLLLTLGLLVLLPLLLGAGCLGLGARLAFALILAQRLILVQEKCLLFFFLLFRKVKMFLPK